VALSTVRPRGRWLPYAAHVPVVVWLFAGPLLQGRVLYFRDLSLQYYPTYAFVARWIRQGVWPLWNPMVDAGTPFLLAYPLDLLLLWLTGARATLAIGPALHVLLAMCGGTRLARVLGAGAWGAWLAGAVLGASGYVLSCVNLLQLLQAASWAPWVLSAFLCCLRDPTGPRVAALAVLGALQLSTAGGEIALQTALCGLLLLPARPARRAALAVAGAGVLAIALAAPALLGLGALIAGSRRAAGFSASEVLAWSASPLVLAEGLLPRFFGDVHTFSDVGYWGQRFFTGGYPYLLSAYVGVPVLLAALAAGRAAPARRLWMLCLLGLLLALGASGPFGPLLAGGLSLFRTPVKFLFVPTLALALLAGLGLDRVIAGSGRRASLGSAAPAALLLAAGITVSVASGRLLDLWSRLAPGLFDPRARAVAQAIWPAAFLTSGVLACAAWACLRAGGHVAPLAGVVAVLDLLIVNGELNPSTDASFYTLQPEVAALVQTTAGGPEGRWFSYGVSNSPGVHWSADVARLNSDVWLYHADRQALWAQTPLLDGLPTAYGEDRAGWAPAGSTLAPSEALPALYGRIHERLRRANVRWVLSFHDLRHDGVVPRGEARIREVLEPLRLYQIADAWPRAFWVPPTGLGTGPASGGAGTAAFEQLDPHTVRVRSSGAPGYLVVLEGYDTGWTVEHPEGAPLQRAYDRYWALPTPGGDREFLIRFAPRWRVPALASALLAAAGTVAVAFRARGRWCEQRRAVA
jgi:hypothetical protein